MRLISSIVIADPPKQILTVLKNIIGYPQSKNEAKESL
jgi:hypothetical protein